MIPWPARGAEGRGGSSGMPRHEIGSICDVTAVISGSLPQLLLLLSLDRARARARARFPLSLFGLYIVHLQISRWVASDTQLKVMSAPGKCSLGAGDADNSSRTYLYT